MCKMKFQIVIHRILKVILYVIGMFLCKDNPLQTAYAFNYSMCFLKLFASFGMSLFQLASNMVCLEDVLLSLLLVWNGEIYCRNNN